MKRLLATLMAVLLLFAASCGKKNSFDITVRVPSGEGTVTGYSDEDLMSQSGTITIKVPAGIPDGSIKLASFHLLKSNPPPQPTPHQTP